MRRLHADRGDNPDPGIQDRWMCVPTKIVDEQCAIRQRTQLPALARNDLVQADRTHAR
jgi:hypothetical protein